MRVVTLGEVMIRMMPPGWERLTKSLPGVLESTFGGAEVNVAVSIAAQGGTAAYCSPLPDNPITTAFEGELRRYGVDDSLVNVAVLSPTIERAQASRSFLQIITTGIRYLAVRPGSTSQGSHHQSARPRPMWLGFQLTKRLDEAFLSRAI
jgi:hypothetical protein